MGVKDIADRSSMYAPCVGPVMLTAKDLTGYEVQLGVRGVRIAVLRNLMSDSYRLFVIFRPIIIGRVGAAKADLRHHVHTVPLPIRRNVIPYT